MAKDIKNKSQDRCFRVYWFRKDPDNKLRNLLTELIVTYGISSTLIGLGSLFDLIGKFNGKHGEPMHRLANGIAEMIEATCDVFDKFLRDSESKDN
jgi:hypothetical protein